MTALYHEKGQKCKLVYINPTDPPWTEPEAISLPPEKERNLPGSIILRRHVKERVLRSQQHTVCEGCGTQITYQPKQIHEPLTPNSEREEAAQATACEEEVSDGEKSWQHAEPFENEPKRLRMLP